MSNRASVWYFLGSELLPSNVDWDMCDCFDIRGTLMNFSLKVSKEEHYQRYKLAGCYCRAVD